MRNLTVFKNPVFGPSWTAASNENFWSEVEEMFGRMGKSAGPSMATFEPRADIDELHGAFKISVDLPGLKDTDVELKLEERLLTLKAKREDKRETPEGAGLRRERFFGEYQRSFRLPQNVDGAHIAAEMKNGVLEITIPKAAEAQPKTIPIKLT